MITKHYNLQCIPVDAVLAECTNPTPTLHRGAHCFVLEHQYAQDRYDVWLKDGTKITTTGYYKSRFQVILPYKKVPNIGLHLPQ